jgi:hypothetical protein
MAAIAVLAAALLSGGVPGWAESTQVGRRDDQFLRDPAVMDWRIIESRQRRLIFEQQQQRLREDDRANAGRSQPNLRVPRMRTGCQAPLRGGASIGGC